jgi:hypothetical protein
MHLPHLFLHLLLPLPHLLLHLLVLLHKQLRRTLQIDNLTRLLGNLDRLLCILARLFTHNVT